MLPTKRYNIMLLSELLRPDLIKVGIEATTPKAAIAELVDVLVQQHEVSLAQRSAVLESVYERENNHRSGMVGGIAIPHGSTDAIEDLLCVLGTSVNGIDFESADGAPAKLVILLVASKRNFTGEVKTLVGIKHLLDNEGLKSAINGATDAEAIFTLIEKTEHESMNVSAS